jgi:hypothetical protein
MSVTDQTTVTRFVDKTIGSTTMPDVPVELNGQLRDPDAIARDVAAVLVDPLPSRAGARSIPPAAVVTDQPGGPRRVAFGTPLDGGHADAAPRP